MSFENKVILITGAGSGIGANTARYMAKLGGKVALVDCNQNGLNVVVDQIKNAGSPTPLGIVADVTKDAQRIIDETINHFGKLNILVNNVGVIVVDSINKFEINEFDRIFNVNLRSVVILTKLAVSHLEKTKGNIVNVSSLAGLRAVENMMSYGMSKAALDQFTKCSALGLASKGIRINSINPAAIRTEILQTMDVRKDHYETLEKKYLVGRVGEAQDVSAAIAYLASDEASFLNGISLPVDGGRMLAGFE